MLDIDTGFRKFGWISWISWISTFSRTLGNIISVQRMSTLTINPSQWRWQSTKRGRRWGRWCRCSIYRHPVATVSDETPHRIHRTHRSLIIFFGGALPLPRPYPYICILQKPADNMIYTLLLSTASIRNRFTPMSYIKYVARDFQISLGNMEIEREAEATDAVILDDVSVGLVPIAADLGGVGNRSWEDSQRQRTCRRFHRITVGKICNDFHRRFSQ